MRRQADQSLLADDLNSVNQMEGAATSGIWRSLGEGAPFDVAAYPFNEWKYMLEGEIRLVQDGETVSAFKGDTLYIPKVSLDPSSRSRQPLLRRWPS